jgi:hypothetical protein
MKMLCASSRVRHVALRPGLEGKPSGGALEGLDCIFVDDGDDNSWGEGACLWQPANTILTARAMGAKTRTFSS